MKYIQQFAIIALISLAGEILNHVLPCPVPSSIYGILILLVLPSSYPPLRSWAAPAW